jgi:hypothetical protein
MITSEELAESHIATSQELLIVEKRGEYLLGERMDSVLTRCTRDLCGLSMQRRLF